MEVMEGLKKLQKLQSMMEMMQSFGIIITSSSDDDSTSLRFLANLALFVVQECCELDIDTKCHLIREHFPKFSPSFFVQASKCISSGASFQEPKTQDGNEEIQNTSLLCRDDKAGLGQKQMDYEDVALISLDSMERANSTLEDFCRSYFMFHKMDAHQPQSIFEYLPILSFTESFIYQLDSLNEQLLQPPKENTVLYNKSLQGADQSLALKPVNMKADPFSPLVAMLESSGLLTDRINEEFKSGIEYWSLERKLCYALSSKMEISLMDVMQAIRLKSFDYRVLNLLLYQLRGEKVNELHMEFLSISEFLVEICDDLFDYEDDVLNNNFNILRMFGRIYGPRAAPVILAQCITEAEEKYDSLLKALDPDLSVSHQRRCEEATKEGGKTCGPSLGTWCIPPIIADEDLYRSKVLRSKP
ncbi:uncharacterized protein LOC115998264 [Ipomoea triloba]|uniref:uncharacterized protein LOC115998264 n=1 Tax=Ipomoea triloba TaxID=35885 RepID=UPI00125E0CAD|nr:uncharacterized protein LOC115998264 [Ipomoea triloba]